MVKDETNEIPVSSCVPVNAAQCQNVKRLHKYSKLLLITRTSCYGNGEYSCRSQ